MRNCIVHAGGTVGAREQPRLAKLVPALQQGDAFPLDEPLWRRLLDALWAHAQDVDLLVRVGYLTP